MVPIKFVTMFADSDSGKCISLNTYVIRLLPTAAIAIISNACMPCMYQIVNKKPSLGKTKKNERNRDQQRKI
jgi:hypothetical protein